MTLGELKHVLAANPGKALRLRLPGNAEVPASFHITEAGQVEKRFIDCGGSVRSSRTCVLQAWIGPDSEHRLNSSKLEGILRLARAVVSSDELPVELEYEDRVISQYPLTGYHADAQTVTFELGSKHTDCLAKDKCGVPTAEATPATAQAQSGGGCCAPGCCG